MNMRIKLLTSILIASTSICNCFAEPTTVVYKINPAPISPRDFMIVDSIRSSLMRKVEPGSWLDSDANDGDGAGTIFFANNALVIYNETAVHKKIQNQKSMRKKIVPVKKKSVPLLSGIEELKDVASELQKKISVKFDEEPLRNAINTIARESKIVIKIDSKSLRDLGIAVDVPVNCEIKNVSTLAALEQTLKEVDRRLTWSVKGKELLVTTISTSEDALTKKTYKTSRFNLQNVNHKLTQEALAQIISYNVDMTSWGVVGGPGQIEVLNNGDMVIKQTTRNHVKIQALLAYIADAS